MKIEKMEKSIKKKSIKKNYLYNVIYQVFLLLSPLLVTPYISRVLSADGIGQYSFTLSIATYFTIFGALGFNYYAQREIAKHQDDKYEQSKILYEVFICRGFAVSISIITNLLLCIFYIYGEYTNLMLILSLNIIAVAFDITFFFQGNEEFGKIIFRNIIIKIISIIAIFVFVNAEDDLNIYTFINATSTLISNIALWGYMPKYLKKVSFKLLKPFSHLKGTLKLFIPTIATSIYLVLDKTLIGVMITDTYVVVSDGIEVVKNYSDLENGYYEQAMKLVKMAMVIITSMGTVMIPRNSNEIKNGNIEKVKSNIYTSSKLVWMLGIPMVFGLILVAPNMVPWFFGDGYDKCIILISIFSFLIIIIGFSNVLGIQYLVPSGKDNIFAICLLVGAAINLTLNLILIPYFWSIGAAISSICAELVITLLMTFFVRKELNILKILILSWKYLISGIIMFVCVYFVSIYLTSSIINSIVIVISGILIYGICLTILKDEFVLKYIRKISKKMKK